LKKALTALVILGTLTPPGFARDLGVLVLPIHQGKWTSSLLYEYLKVRDDFNTRGRVDFTGHVVGSAFSYGVTDQVALAIKGGVLVDLQEESQGSQWQSRAGYLYGLDVYNEAFPATGLWPGVQLSGGVTGFQLPLDRTNATGSWQAIDQKLSGVEYHGAVLGVYKFGRLAPYAGLRGFGSTVTWRDNQATGSTPDHITGHAHGNISIVAGLPVQLTQEVRMQLEGRFINETAATVGFTIAAF
jgi:hypothetical protein